MTRHSVSWQRWITLCVMLVLMVQAAAAHPRDRLVVPSTDGGEQPGTVPRPRAAADEPLPATISTQQAAHAVYLPVAMGRPGAQPPTLPEPNPPTPQPPAGGSDTGAVWLPYRKDTGDLLHTYGASVAIDGAGGIHVAYALYSGDDAGLRPATYAYCRSSCVDKRNWSFTSLGSFHFDVRLQLTSSGQPRLVLFGPMPDDPSDPYNEQRMRYQYAECNAECSDAAHWIVTTIVTPVEFGGGREERNNQYFALDAQGRPAFVYRDTTNNQANGTFFVSCQRDCAHAGNWSETKISAMALSGTDLSFAPGGQPRLAAQGNDRTSTWSFWYLQCDVACTDGANWSEPIGFHGHGSGGQSLAVDSQGRPRMMWYSGSYAEAPYEAGRLYYFWCDASCADGRNWSFTPVELAKKPAEGLDLVLDRQDRPRLVYEEFGQGLGYAWCTSACQSESAVWQSRTVESSAALANDYEVLPVKRCTVSTWFNGVRPALALDAAGNPRIAYDAQHYWYGTELVNGVPHQCNYKDVNVTRLALFAQP